MWNKDFFPWNLCPHWGMEQRFAHCKNPWNQNIDFMRTLGPLISSSALVYVHCVWKMNLLLSFKQETTAAATTEENSVNRRSSILKINDFSLVSSKNTKQHVVASKSTEDLRWFFSSRQQKKLVKWITNWMWEVGWFGG